MAMPAQALGITICDQRAHTLVKLADDAANLANDRPRVVWR